MTDLTLEFETLKNNDSDAELHCEYSVFWMTGDSEEHAEVKAGKPIQDFLDSPALRLSRKVTDRWLAAALAEQLLEENAGAVMVLKELSRPVCSEVAAIVAQ